MRILVVSQYYYPENFRINDICEELVQRGHKVTVLTGLPNYPDGFVPKEYRHGKKRHEAINGVEVIRCFEIARGKGSLRRILNYFSFMLSGAYRARRLNKDAYDVIYGYAPSPIMQMRAAQVFKRRSSKRILFYCCDIWPEAVKTMLPGEKNLAFRWAKRISYKIYKACDVIQVTSRPFIAYIRDGLDIPESRIQYLPQHAEDVYLSDDFTTADNDVCDFLFAGNVGTVQNMDCIVRACAKIGQTKRPYMVHILGDGSYLQKTKALVTAHGLEDKFVFHGRHPIEAMPEFYKLADVCLLTLKHENAIGLTLPSKLQGYMAAGKPVIGAIDGAAQEVIEESGCGICVPASDSVALAAAMIDIINYPEKYTECGIKGREYFKQHFTKAKFMDSLENSLYALMENKNV